MKIILKAPAKINLFLEIKNKRTDGYHNLESIMQTINLYDKLYFELTEKKFFFGCSDKSLLNTNINIVCKTVKIIKQYYNIKKGVKIYLKKEIPIGAGLGGGSSDAATTIKALVKLWNIKTTKKELEQIAIKLGADVSFFLTGGTALCEGIGEIITPLKNINKLNIIIINPGFNISTSEAYKKIIWPLTNKKTIHTIKDLICNNLFSTNESFRNCFNRLEEFVFPYYPKVAEIKEVLNKFNYVGLMSGSGSTVFGISDSIIRTKQLQSKFNRYGYKIWITTTVNPYVSSYNLNK
jgi:4-diphosphocytidyl-2-C-methyl-D-erythritol kinase